MMGEPVTLSPCDDPQHGPDCIVWSANEVVAVHLPSVDARAILAKQQTIDDQFHKRESARRLTEVRENKGAPFVLSW